MSDTNASGRLSRWTYFGYGIGSMGTGIFATIPGLLLLSFLVRQLAVPAALAGLVMLVPRLWDVVTDPLAGSLSDRTRTRIGARRPWLLAGSILMPIAFLLLFRVPDVTGTSAALYVLVVYIFGTTAYTVFQVPYVALPAEMTDDYDERTTIMAWRIAFLTVGILVGGGAAPEIVNMGGGGREGYGLMAIVLAAFLFVVLFSTFIGTRSLRVFEPAVSTATIREQIRTAAENKPFLWLLGGFLLQALGIGAMLAGVEFYSTYLLLDSGETTILFVLLVAPALLTMPLWTWVGHRFGKKAGYMACVTIFGLGGLSLLAVNADRVWLAYVIVFVMGSAYAGTQMFPFAMLPDAIAADTAKTGLRRAGSFTGIWTAGEKGGLSVGPVIFAACLAVTGFIETEEGAIVDQPDAAIAGIVVGFAVIPSILMLVSLLFLRRYDLDDETMRQLAIDNAAAAAAAGAPAPLADPTSDTTTNPTPGGPDAPA